MSLNWLGSKAVMQGPAKPYRPVRLRSQPPITKKSSNKSSFFLFIFFNSLNSLLALFKNKRLTLFTFTSIETIKHNMDCLLF